MKTRISAILLFALSAAIIALYPYKDIKATPNTPVLIPMEHPTPIIHTTQQKPNIEVVFVLDTTGSMSGLIRAAKENIWAIATNMASAEQAPEIKIGLVAYRDRGDEYVTKRIDLSSDLDSTYAALMDFEAGGGGDGPESVNQALHEAVNKFSWSQSDDNYKVIFLVGDAPPHKDYKNDIQYPETLKAAAKKGIVINTIQAGKDSITRQEWKTIASLNQGHYFQVNSTGNAVAIATPFDKKIAALSKDLDETRLFYGDEKSKTKSSLKQAAAEKLHAIGSISSRAKRAAFNSSASGKGNFLGEQELVEDIATGRVALDSIDPSHLPAPLAALGKEEQKKIIQEKSKKRKALKNEIAELSNQRQTYIKTQLKKDTSAPKSLDDQIYQTVKTQTASKGLRYESDAVY